jgi:hypothetical protein
MKSRVWGGGKTAATAVALVVAIMIVSRTSARAGGSEGIVQGVFHQGQHHPGEGTLGYGGYGLYPGLAGFGLAFHPGYGYGSKALGVGIYGGYPFYGGPGYPQPDPCLRRFHGITPFLYNGGPGYPSYEFPHFYGGIGPLVVGRPVVTIADQPAPGEAYGSDFGPFTGHRPYPETLFAPYTDAASMTGSSTGTNPYSPSRAPLPALPLDAPYGRP